MNPEEQNSQPPNLSPAEPTVAAPQPEQQVGNVVPPARKGLPKKVLILILLLVLATAAAAVYFLVLRKDTPTTNNGSQSLQQEDNATTDADLLEYTDEVGRFTVQYPRDWVVEVDQSLGGEDTKYADIVSPTGLKVKLSSNLGGRGIPFTCTYDEATGISEWTDESGGSDDSRCPYTTFHASVKTEAQGLNNLGMTDYVYVVDRSFTEFDESGTASSTYSVCAQLGDVAVGEKEYGPTFVDPEITTYVAAQGANDRFIKACVAEFGTDESFLQREDVGIAREILASIRFL